MTTEEQRAAFRDLNDRHIMQLAGISTAAVQNTRETTKDRITRENPYWTQSYEDVCVAVDREIAQRERAEKAEKERDEARAAGAEMREIVRGIAGGRKDDPNQAGGRIAGEFDYADLRQMLHVLKHEV